MESATCCGMESRFSEYGINANCIVWNPQLVAAWNLALASMESMPIALYGIKTEGERRIQPVG